MSIDEALQMVHAAGYVTLREKSYHQAQERQRVAEALRQHADQDVRDTRVWANQAFDEQRRLQDRLTFVYGVAMAHGATRDELAGSTGFHTIDPEETP